MVAKSMVTFIISNVIKSLNYHDCTKCECCGNNCDNPEKRFQCNCNCCNLLKCPCDDGIFYDINILAARCRAKFNIAIDNVPKCEINEQKFQTKNGYQYKLTHPRNTDENEIDN